MEMEKDSSNARDSDTSVILSKEQLVTLVKSLDADAQKVVSISSFYHYLLDELCNTKDPISSVTDKDVAKKVLSRWSSSADVRAFYTAVSLEKDCQPFKSVVERVHGQCSKNFESSEEDDKKQKAEETKNNNEKEAVDDDKYKNTLPSDVDTYKEELQMLYKLIQK